MRNAVECTSEQSVPKDEKLKNVIGADAKRHPLAFENDKAEKISTAAKMGCLVLAGSCISSLC